ncbi:DUF4132 domain-containing protein [Catellatospora sp. NPDC049133]|uniref:DUF4132 domain-containing protein n=1 Tax=Catellatospora sp. NPDC049133 TaxID=3155499 RepID=UPI0033F2E4CE
MEQLIPKLSDVWQEHLDADSEASGRRLGNVLGTAWKGWVRDLTALPGWAAVQAWPPQDRRGPAMHLHALACAGRLDWPTQRDLLRHLAAEDAPWTSAHLSWCLRQVARSVGCDGELLHLELPAALAARLPGAQLVGHQRALEAVLAIVEENPPDDVRLERRLSAALNAGIRKAGNHALPVWLGQSAGTLGAAVQDRLGDVLRGTGVGDLLDHCSTLEKLTPDVRWRRRAEQLLSAAAGGDDVVRGILGCFAEHTSYVFEEADRLLRALAWLLAADPGPAATALMARVTDAAALSPHGDGHPRAPLTANAAVTLLARRDGDVPLTTLARLSTAVRNKGLQKRVRATLAQLGEARGRTYAEMLELCVATHGLGADGRLVEPVGGYQAVVALVDERARLSFRDGDSVLRSVPAAVRDGHPADLKRLRELVKEIGRTVTAERRRVESVLSEERDWAYADWTARYLDHAVTGVFGRSLIWETGDGEGWTAGVPVRDGDGWALRGPNGVTVRGTRVRLWHPVRATAAEVARWRDHVAAGALRQPFKQAFREVYRLTPAEEQTATYSNRFAAHILRYRQANALMRARGWHAGFLGPWDGGYHSEAVRELGGGGWRASFDHALADGTDRRHGEARYCTTDQVRFARRDGRGWRDVPLAEVPVPVFSEAMRDVDLFVGVTSIAADPQWADHGERRFDDYWRSAGFGELTATAQMRREALERLLPRTRLATRTSLTERWLRVQSSLRAYRIHLGSGNVLMEPDDAYLCIVPARSPAVRLPFDEDTVLNAIVAKAFLLAADEKITDPSILRQLGR